jgi:hypothetical protein
MLPPPASATQSSPLIRTNSGFKVDRFGDLRDKGY